MKKLVTFSAVSALAVSFANISLVGFEAKADTSNLTEAVTKGTVTVGFRYRFETVDQENVSEDAEASTLRTRLNFQTAEYKDLKLLLELGNVAVIGSERYNSTRNGKTDFPVVADPDGSEVNQGYLSYSPENANIMLGRQRIIRDNQRFIGGVAWRQNEQTFDSITLGNTTSDWRLDYGYIWKVKRIFGPDSGNPAASFDSDSHIFNVRLDHSPKTDLRAYGYLLDLENAPALSNSTYGVRLSGVHAPSKDKVVNYSAEYAYQSDYGDNPSDYTANYYLLELGGGVGSFSAKLGWEVLEGDRNQPGRQFVTPLATLHKFQGWADKFLTTPNSGIDDRYFALNTKILGATATLVYHRFEAEADNQKYGDEWNFSLAKTLDKRHKFLLKYADYNAETLATDTTKWWFQYSVDFPN